MTQPYSEPTTTIRRKSDPFAPPPRRTPADPYLKTRVMTASPEQLQVMLFDGAIRFGEQAKTAIGEQRYDQMHERLTRAQDIVIELQNGLRPDKDPDNCKRLESLYGWCYLRLVEGNVGRDPDKIEEALGVLRYQRETWQMIAAARANEAATLAAADEQRGGLRLAG